MSTKVPRTTHQWLKPLYDFLDNLFTMLLGGMPAFEADAVASSALAANTYANGTLGVGATLTGNANGAFATIDGVAPVVNQTYLIAAESTASHNGYYTLTQVGDAGTPYILTRVAGFDQLAEVKTGTIFGIRGGTVNAGTTWKYTGADGPTMGSTSLTFARDPGVMTTNSAQTVTAAKKFTTLLLQVLAASGGFVTKFVTLATADRTATFPDVDLTVAQAGVASGGAAPTGILDLATPVFSGTGQSSAGQVITTTDNQTMTLNQCAGMWFVSATHGPYLIASNTAVAGAAAVLTILGTAPTTDAGAYKIVRTLVASHTHLQT